MAAKYALPDEPRPGPLAQAVVEPMWPLLAVMAGGTWLSWPWFVFNAFAVGAPRRWASLLLALCGLLGAAGIFVVIAAAFESNALATRESLRLAMLVLVAWKVGISYVLHALQAKSIALHQYYRGVVRQGLPVVVLGYFASRWLSELPTFAYVVLR